jgi:hypothetical protein
MKKPGVLDPAQTRIHPPQRQYTKRRPHAAEKNALHKKIKSKSMALLNPYFIALTRKINKRTQDKIKRTIAIKPPFNFIIPSF